MRSCCFKLKRAIYLFLFKINNYATTDDRRSPNTYEKPTCSLHVLRSCWRSCRVVVNIYMSLAPLTVPVRVRMRMSVCVCVRPCIDVFRRLPGLVWCGWGWASLPEFTKPSAPTSPATHTLHEQSVGHKFRTTTLAKSFQTNPYGQVGRTAQSGTRRMR